MEAPSQEAAHPGQGANIAAGIQLDGTEGTAQDPPTLEEQVVDPCLPQE